MIEVDISVEQLDKARKQSTKMGTLPNSITNGGGNLAGFIGEIVVADLLDAEIKNTYDYDIVDKHGSKIDVKTKRCNTKPKDYYECSIASHGTKQKCNEYIFVRVMNNLTKAWVLGRISKNDYFKNSTYHNKGDIDPDNGFKFKSSCYNLPINKLGNLNEETNEC
tara:strand:- start:186 stop:680 length:495 start_codon:yes stop_codon:yes gene_type:complete